jgi:dehydrogenase/reductase SDR family member 12
VRLIVVQDTDLWVVLTLAILTVILLRTSTMRLHETRQIERPVEEVFAFTADFANTEEWDPGVESARQIGSGPVGAGTTYEVVTKFGSSRIPMEYRIEEYEPNSRVVLEGRGETVSAVDTIEFEPRDGGTFVDYTADLTFANWIRHIDPLLKPLMSRLVGRRALDGLVATLEK